MQSRCNCCGKMTENLCDRCKNYVCLSDTITVEIDRKNNNILRNDKYSICLECARKMRRFMELRL